MTATFQAVADTVGAVVPEHLIASAEIPVTTRAIQGDVMILPTLVNFPSGEQPVPAAGINLVVEDIGRERHILSADPDSGVMFTSASDSINIAGYVHVPEGAVAYVTHTGEHGSVALEGGHNYQVVVQTDPVEQARAAD